MHIEKRYLLGERYHALDVRDFDVGSLARCMEHLKGSVLVQGARATKEIDEWFSSRQALSPGGPVSDYTIRNVQFDLAISVAEFVQLLPLWRWQGVDAFVTERGPVKVNPSRLEALAAYRALENFGFLAALHIGGSGLDNASLFVSPSAGFIDHVAEVIDVSRPNGDGHE